MGENESDSIPLLHTDISSKDKDDFNERISDYLGPNDNDSVNDDSCDSGILETVRDDKSSIDPIENDIAVLRRVAKIGVCKAIPTTPCGECRTVGSFNEEFPLNQSIFIQMNNDNDDENLNDNDDENFDPLNNTSTNADFEWRELNENPDDNVLEDTTFPNLFDKLNDDKESTAVVSSICNGEANNSALQCNFESEFQNVAPIFAAAFHTITSEFNSVQKSEDASGTNEKTVINKDHSNKKEKDDNDKNVNNISQKSSKIIPLIRPPPQS